MALAVAAAAIAVAGPASAADVKVSYRVDAKTLKSSTPVGTPLTFELYSDSTCTTLVKTATVNAESVALIEQLRPIKVKQGPKPPNMADVQYTLTGVSPEPAFYLKVTGAGIAPIGGACQLQTASVGGTLPPAPLSCPADSVISGSLCVDKYEASLWDIPPAQTTVIQHVKDGTATAAELTGAGAVQVGCPGSSYSHTEIPGTFPANGAYTAPIYAASLSGILPSACLSPYQAIAACQLSNKKLMSNTEWTAAAQGTPSHVADNGTTDCNTASVSTPINTGARSGCTSTAGIFDAVGNVWEWTVDSGAWFRGGDWGYGTSAGVLFADRGDPRDQLVGIGFRCAR